MNQEKAVDAMMKKAQAALLWSEKERNLRLMRRFQSMAKKLVTELKAIAADNSTNGKLDVNKWRLFQNDYRSFQIIKEQCDALGVEYSKIVENDIKDHYREAYNRYAWMLDNSTPPNVDVVYNAPSDAYLRAYLSQPWRGYMFSERIGRITDEMARSIQNTLINSMQAGDSVDDMARKIWLDVGVDPDAKLKTRPRASAALYRAELISRTEMIRASRIAQEHIFAQNSDIIDDKVWTMKYGGAGVCWECRAKDGKTEKEILKMGLTIDEHPNGRCCWLPRVKTWNELLGPEKSKGMIDEMDIDETAMKVEDMDGRVTVQKITDYETWAETNLSPYERTRMGAD